MAVFGPLALFSGIGVLGTVWAGTPGWLVLIFLLAAAGAVFFTLLYAATDSAERGKAEK